MASIPKDHRIKTDPSVGEIDTSTPFQSVKDAVNLFGEGSFSGEKITINKIKPHSAERVLVKETKLQLAQREIYKLKERLKSAETTKADALIELELAKRRVEDLNKKLEEAKDAAIKMAKNQAKHIECKENGLKQDLEYAAVFTELDAAKQELRRICFDRETAVEEENSAIKQETESAHIKKVNLDRAGEITKQTVSVQETVQEKVFAERNVQKLAHKAALRESAQKLFALQERVGPEKTSEVKRLQTEVENVRVLDLDSLKSVTLELDGAKGSLQKMVEEESSLKKLLKSLKIELENVKNEHEELKAKEAEAESVVGNRNSKLQESSMSDEKLLAFQKLVTENENAKQESEDMKKEAEAMRVALEEAESKLKVALMEAEEAKKAESKALNDIKAISERTDAARASTLESGSKITISREEYEALTRKVLESEKLVELKAEAAKAQVEALKASETEAMKKLKAAQREVLDLKAETEAALKRAVTAETCKKVVENELKRWKEREQKKAAEAVALMLQETQMQQTTTPTPKPSLPLKYMQSPPQKQKTKKIFVSNLSSIFHRKKSQVDAGSSPSYLPGEKPV